MKTIALIILSVIFIISAAFAVAGLGVQSLLYPESYEGALEKSGVYSAALQNIDLPGITTKDIKPIVNELLDRVFAYMRSETNQINLTLSPQSAAVQSLINAKLAGLPTCSAGQEPANGSEIICRPAGVNNETLLSYLPPMEIPSIDLAPMFGGEIQKVRDMIAAFRSALTYSVIVAVVCIAAIFFLSRSLKWVGVNLIIVGLIGISFSMFRSIIASVIGNSPVLPIVEEILPVVTDKIVLYGAALLAAGVVLLAISFLKKKNK